MLSPVKPVREGKKEMKEKGKICPGEMARQEITPGIHPYVTKSRKPERERDRNTHPGNLFCPFATHNCEHAPRKLDDDNVDHDHHHYYCRLYNENWSNLYRTCIFSKKVMTFLLKRENAKGKRTNNTRKKYFNNKMERES